MNGHHHHRLWAPSRQMPNTSSSSTGPSYDAYYNEKNHAHSNASWLAGYDPRTRQSLPVHYDHDKRSSWALLRLSHLRNSLLRRFPFLQAFLPSRRSSLTSSAPTPLSILASAPAFPSTDTIRFVFLCALWYTSSALSSNTGKAIMNQFRYPVTLTFVQFGFVAGYCLVFMSPLVKFTKMRSPTKAILKTTFPMGCFQVGGHIFSSMAISRIPVSTVHTIKALSPLFTVAAYALLFGVSYSPKTYFSLVPLTIGVMLACSFDMSASNALGLLCAFGSAVVFVTSNIFFKKIMPSSTSSGSSATTSHKLDKVNLLFYSSGMAFLLMIPIWVWTDLPSLLASSDNTHVGHPPHGSPSPHGYSTPVNFFLNGTVHFLQNVLAFVLLAQTSPVTYSIASLIKRVAVICIAVVWFAQSVHPVQGFGICLTFVGLWCYNNAKSDVERGEKKVRRVENAREGVLPSTRAQLVEAGEEEVGWEMEKEKEKERGEKVEVKSTGVPVATMVYTRPRAYTQHTPTTTAHRHHLHSFAPPPPLPSLRHTTPTAATQDSVSHPPAVLSTSKTLPTTYSQTHPNAHPNLHIQIATPPPPPVTLPSKNVHNDNSNNNNHSEVRTKTSKAIMGGEPTLSPIESYPSPPLSEDSPIEEEQGLKDGLGGTPWMKQRRATITGHGHHGHANGLSGTRGQSQTVVVNA